VMKPSLKFTNKQVSELLREVAAVYEIKGENAFRIKAYNNAADSVEHAASDVRDLWETGNLKELSGIGEGLSAYLDELFKTGKVRHFEEIKKSVPNGVFGLIKVSGVGPKTAYKLSKAFDLDKMVTSISALKKKALEGKIRLLEGFGEDSERKILNAIKEFEDLTRRMLLYQADTLSLDVIEYLEKSPLVERADSLGSLRRRVPTIGDIDIAVSSNAPSRVVNYFVKYKDISKVLNKGTVKASVLLDNDVQVDLRAQESGSYGSLLQYFTGSKMHNIRLRKYAQSKGLSLSEYGIKKGNKLLEFADEKSFYNFLGMDYIPPELREDTGEIDAALSHKLPRLVELGDIKGDLQMHSTQSDGQNSLEEMIKACEDKHYQYMGITDHQVSLNTHSEKYVNEVISKRRWVIDQYNYSHKSMRVLFGIELNVSADNRLVYPDRLLNKFDYVIAAIHTGFDQPKTTITNRIITALENPYVKVFAHPTGRLLGERAGYSVDWEKVFLACKEYNKVLEINSFPTRLDLPEELIRRALKEKVRLVINTDSHSIDHLDYMTYGVSMARRGWCTKDDIINTYSLKDLLEILDIERW